MSPFSPENCVVYRDTLKMARDLIADPGRWCQEAGARTKKGRPCPASSPNAWSFCLDSAIRVACWARADDDDAIGSECGAIASLVTPIKARAGRMLDHMEFNDSSTHEEVLAVLDEAIANCDAVARGGSDA
jgi:hypothetical protein